MPGDSLEPKPSGTPITRKREDLRELSSPLIDSLDERISQRQADIAAIKMTIDQLEARKKIIETEYANERRGMIDQHVTAIRTKRVITDLSEPMTEVHEKYGPELDEINRQILAEKERIANIESDIAILEEEKGRINSEIDKATLGK